MNDLALVWLRRDLRLNDHAALSLAQQNHARVLPVFIFDTTLLELLPRNDRRVPLIWHALAELKNQLNAAGSDLVVRTGNPVELIPALATELGAAAVYTNRDYEPMAITRDAKVEQALAVAGVAFESGKDQVIFERDEVLSKAGTPFSVFTPYWRAWLARFTAADAAEWPVDRQHFASMPPSPLPSLAELGFDEAPLPIPAGESGAQALLADFMARIDHYADWRDFPGKKGVSYLSPHLRFGTVSIRELVRQARSHEGEGAATWLKELGWREFYQQLLWHHPRVVGQAFKPEFNNLPFPNREDWFAAWCEGQTGYPLVDAAMRQLNQTGFMHNRLRMIAASFLVKDLLIDWRWGEAYFARQLLDFDLASNNGGWQWAASVGCDAQPWFRIFNPVTQSQKFDPDGRFIRRYCPELASLGDADLHAPWLAKPLDLQAAGVRLGLDYPFPLVDHATQREAVLALYRRDRS